MAKQSNYVTIWLPKIVKKSDYHEFGNLQDDLRALHGTKQIKVSEIGFDGNRYVGVVYIGKKPSDAYLRKAAPDAFSMEGINNP